MLQKIVLTQMLFFWIFYSSKILRSRIHIKKYVFFAGTSHHTLAWKCITKTQPRPSITTQEPIMEKLGWVTRVWPLTHWTVPLLLLFMFNSKMINSKSSFAFQHHLHMVLTRGRTLEVEALHQFFRAQHLKQILSTPIYFGRGLTDWSLHCCAIIICDHL